jgi:hypothetical protein
VASLVGALTTNFLLYAMTGQRLDHWDPNVFLAALLVGTLLLVVVSLLTRPEPAAGIDDLFNRLKVSSDDEQPRPLLLVNLLDLRRAAAGRGWTAFREDVIGFAVGWAIVIVLVAATAFYLGS